MDIPRLLASNLALPLGQSEKVLGVVNLDCISIRNPAYGVPEGMVRMGNVGNAAKARGGAMVRSRYINLEASYCVLP
jgi:hypothetical protein